MNNEVDNVISPSFGLTTLEAGQNKMLYLLFFIYVSLFVCLFVYKGIQFVHLGDIWLTIQHSSKYLFVFLIIRPDFVLTGGVVIFEGMSVFVCRKVFFDVVSLGSMILS